MGLVECVSVSRQLWWRSAKPELADLGGERPLFGRHLDEAWPDR